MKASPTIWLAGLALAVALSGCGLIDFAVEKGVGTVTPPAMSKPVHSLAGQRVVVLAEAAPGLAPEGAPLAALRVAEAVAKELSDRRAAAEIVNPRDVTLQAQRDPDFNRKSVAEVGALFKADAVVYLVIQAYAVTGAAEAESYTGYVSTAVRVVDVKSKEQVWPPMNQVHFLEARSTVGIKADSLRQAEKVLLAGLARKVGMLFVPYNLEDQPLAPEVR